jgi:hypothetical protein
VGEFVRNNHSVPQAYLRGWSANSDRVWARRLLVPNPAYVEWEQRAIRSLTAYDNLYTSVRGGAESDDFERWIKREIEDPAAKALQLVREDRAPSRQELQRLAYYAAALDLRTPAAYLEHTERWNRQMPGLLQGVLARAKREIRRAARDGRSLPPAHATPDLAPPLRVHVDPGAAAGKSAIKAEITIGRELWLHSMRHLLTKTVSVLLDHDWCIMRPCAGSKWFTSDHPVVRLNYCGADDYDFGGGWGRRGSEILFPLSPSHILYTQIGYEAPRVRVFPLDQTILVQRFVAERSHRWIVADGQPMRAIWFKKRVVDTSAFQADHEGWKRWHSTQSDAERDHPAPEYGDQGAA